MKIQPLMSLCSTRTFQKMDRLQSRQLYEKRCRARIRRARFGTIPRARPISLAFSSVKRLARLLADYLSEKIWAPYGMGQDASWLINEDGTEISGCCIQATTRDFARFGQFMLDGARVDGQSPSCRKGGSKPRPLNSVGIDDARPRLWLSMVDL